MFETVLVANRGEIAVRIFRTLRRLGIRSVAVYSDPDRDARHVREADISFCIGPARALESYLNIENLLEAATASRADAIHPGYGFLAENASFAQACVEHGIAFIGPSPESIAVMGDKIEAKRTVAAAGVSIVPGSTTPGMSDEELVAVAEAVGFPVLVKPSAGGGGTGIRLVERLDDLGTALAASRREAASSFGDDTLFLERFVARPRHIEVQVLADTFGTTVHLGERECSLQRRYQKVIEETPSPLIDAETRERLGSAAVASARSVNYSGAGTVEFIVSSDAPEEFFFMEMNTRLQVEHPVTEMVTGLDLVEEQVRIASGEPLRFTADGVFFNGHAIEARVFAEDPARMFVPTGGRLLLVREPAGEGIRVDTGMIEGGEVGTDYDPLLAKVVAFGPDRPTALFRLQRALAGTVVLGFETNVEFLHALVMHPEVRAGRIDTGFIDRELTHLINREPSATALVIYALERLSQLWPSGPLIDSWAVPSGWRVGRARPLSFETKGTDRKTQSVSILGTPENARVWIGQKEILASIRPAEGGKLATVAGATHRVWTALDDTTCWVFVDGRSSAFTGVVKERRSFSGRSSESEVRSPMPGTVVQVHVAQGDEVRRGQPLVVVEAMKMEHVLNALRDGVVESIVTVDDSVAFDEVVARIAAPAESAAGR